MKDPRKVLRNTLVEAWKKYEKDNNRVPYVIGLSFPLMKLLVGRNIARAMKRHQEDYIWMCDEIQYKIKLVIVDDELGPHFNYLGDKQGLQEAIADYVILQS